MFPVLRLAVSVRSSAESLIRVNMPSLRGATTAIYRWLWTLPSVTSVLAFTTMFRWLFTWMSVTQACWTIASDASPMTVSTFIVVLREWLPGSLHSNSFLTVLPSPATPP